MLNFQISGSYNTHVDRLEECEQALYLGKTLPTFGTGQADLENVVFHRMGEVERLHLLNRLSRTFLMSVNE